jgi:two-component system response regulator (stage 0 sporulation protein A)
MNKTIADTLKELGIPADILGYRYLNDAIEMVLNDDTAIYRVTKEIYPAVAKANKSTASRVERAIRHAVDYAFNKGNDLLLYNMFKGTISNKSGKVTNSTFIATVAEHINFLKQSVEVITNG